VHRLYQNGTAQVSLETLDKLALSEALGRDIEPGDPIEREGKKRRPR
jgi:hypothetical protein